ncbi:integral membrane protein [Mycobacterium tuberculosis]|nr:integral membrane protein [Mycobacterium tuberculosis]
MNEALIGLAFAAGLVAALNPCGFAMLPAYLLLVVYGQDSAGRTGPLSAVGRAAAATVGMALGFLTVFGIFGALTISAATAVQRYLPYATVLIGLALIALGGWLLLGRGLTALTPRSLGVRWAPTVRLGSMYGYGISYAVASLSCTIGPFLAVTGAGLRGGSVVGSVAIYLAYVAGLTLVVGVCLPSRPRPRARRWPTAYGESCRSSTGSVARCWWWSGCTWVTTVSTSCA